MTLSSSGCFLCPRRCGAERHISRGFCGGGELIRVARASLHFWEEPCISGIDGDKLSPEKGSGTVFFSGCPLKCCFCQNSGISSGNFGKDITVERLAEIFIELQSNGAYNLNLVSPTHYAPQIRRALDIAMPSVPIVYNSGGYDSDEALSIMEGAVDIYLPDLKFMSSSLSGKYCGAPDYFDVALSAIHRMIKQVGKPVFDDCGLLKRGVLIRHLVIPGCADDSRKIIRCLAESFGEDEILLSIMSQYVPMFRATDFPEINRKVTQEEYKSVMDAVYETGFEGYFQDADSASEDYTPEFDMRGV